LKVMCRETRQAIESGLSLLTAGVLQTYSWVELRSMWFRVRYPERFRRLAPHTI
jgi:hypothetical protein